MMFIRSRRWHYQPGQPLPRTGIRIWRLNIEYLNLWTGEYGLEFRDSFTWLSSDEIRHQRAKRHWEKQRRRMAD